MKYRLALLAVLLLTLFTGCVRTVLPVPATLAPEVTALAAAANRSIVVTTAIGPQVSHSLGSQFVLGIFPLGRISLEDPARYFEQAAARALAVAGFNPVIERGAGTPSLSIELTDLTVTAYDSVALRHISASASVTIRTADGHSVSATRSALRSRTTAFAPELDAALSTALNEALAAAVTELGQRHLQRLAT